jgi:hypothetical protein
MYNHGILPRGVIGSDGGFGRNQMAIAGLEILQGMGIPCAAVSFLTADLGDARSIYQDGIISVANALAEACGILPGMPAHEAAALLLVLQLHFFAAASVVASRGHRLVTTSPS